MWRTARTLVIVLALGGVALGAAPAATCQALVDALPSALGEATTFVVSVAIEQGRREIAYERSRVSRAADGSTTSTTLERRGLRRPNDAGGADAGGPIDFTLPCDDHDLDVDSDGVAHLTLRDASNDAPVSMWSLQFEYVDGRWRPLELRAPFLVRIVLVPVRGEFITRFAEWRFEDD